MFVEVVRPKMLAFHNYFIQADRRFFSNTYTWFRCAKIDDMQPQYKFQASQAISKQTIGGNVVQQGSKSKENERMLSHSSLHSLSGNRRLPEQLLQSLSLPLLLFSLCDKPAYQTRLRLATYITSGGWTRNTQYSSSK